VVVRTQRLRRPDGDVARVVVQDDGPGIPSDQLHLVFDRYRHGPGGVGLGLAICKEFVELHGGEIWAETPEKRTGCAFVFTLPMARRAEQPKPEPPPKEAGQQPRVLVVEDEPQIAAVVAEILRSRYRVEVARDGAEGLAKARALHPDLVVMDVFLPKLDGLDAALALKESNDTADIPVVLLSAHQSVADKVRALNLGAVDYLAKPFQALELLACAERAIKLRDTQRELERSKTFLRRTGSDPETGLFNRDGLAGRLDQEISRSRRYLRPLTLGVLRPRAPLADVARRAASIIRQGLRAADVLGHVGNGVFALIMPESTREAAAAPVGRIVGSLHEAGWDYATALVELGPDPIRSEDLLDQILGPLT
jgi:PleD family two-component response regulator